MKDETEFPDVIPNPESFKEYYEAIDEYFPDSALEEEQIKANLKENIQKIRSTTVRNYNCKERIN